METVLICQELVATSVLCVLLNPVEFSSLRMFNSLAREAMNYIKLYRSWKIPVRSSLKDGNIVLYQYFKP